MRFRVYYYTVHVEYNCFNHNYPPFLKLPKGISVLISSSTMWHAGTNMLGHMRLPGIMVTRAPSFTLSPTTAPSLRRPLSTRIPFTSILTFLSSSLRFAKSAPPPTLQFLPMIESPTYARCDMNELSMTIEFFISTAWPTLQFLPMEEYFLT